MSDALQVALRKRILAHYLELDERGNFKNAPKTDDELYEFIDIGYNIRFPRKVIEPGHKAPFQFVADLFFERVQNALAFANRAGGKAVALDTPILTSTGFRKIVDVHPGDEVFAPDGTLTRVTVESEIFTEHDCFELIIDGQRVVADAGHLWEVYRTKEWGKFRLMTTQELFDDLQKPLKIGYATRWWIRKTKPLKLPTANLPVHPYVLGIYLGDGCRTNDTIACDDPEIVTRIRILHSDGVVEYNTPPERCPIFRICNIRKILKDAGFEVLNEKGEKQVPKAYLLADEAQRLELLRGLMDSDGHIGPDRPRCEFDTTDLPLAGAVSYLVASLGGNPKFYARGPGIYYEQEHKERYRINFMLESWVPFHLKRKAERCNYTSTNNTDHRIHSIKQTGSVPVKCLGVEHEEHLFLLGSTLIPTHNTFAVALLNHLDMIFKPGCEIASAGAVRDQADKCYRYFQSFLELPWFKELNDRFLKITGRPLLEDTIKSKTKFHPTKDRTSGSVLEIITGTETGLRGPHPNKARIDEVDIIEWSTLQTALSMSHSSEGIRSANVFTSTRQLQDGSMQRLLDEAAEKGIDVYEWNIWEAVQKCQRRCIDDPVHGSCPIYTYCKGKAHHCEGFYTIDDFINKVRLIDRETFETEWENKRPSRHKMVYSMFQHSRHVMTPQRLQQMFGFDYPQMSWYRISGLDFGSSPGHPFVYLKLTQLPNNAWMIFYEYVAEQRLIRDHAGSIRSSPFYYPGELIYADWDAQDRLELQDAGVRTTAAVKGNNTVTMGIDYVKSLLNGFPPSEEPQLYVWYDCPSTIKEFGVYQWPTRPDGRVDKTGIPLKENDHCLDALRYALYSLRRNGRQRYWARNVKGI